MAEILYPIAHEIHKVKKKLYLLDYYPYGKKTEWEYWICGNVNLKEIHKDDRYKGLDSTDLVLGIYEETARAMQYTTIYHPEPLYKGSEINQGKLAFAFFDLFKHGDIEWDKKILKGKTEKEIKKLEKYHQKRVDIVSGYGDNNPNKKHVFNEKEKISRRKKYGMYCVNYYPLTQYSNAVDGKPKILYTFEELCAIHMLVICEFENMC